MRWKILVTHPEVPKPALELLANHSEVIMCDSVPTNREEILAKSNGVDAIFWAGHDALNAEALDKAGSQLKAISTMSAGIDYVDIAEMQRRRIPLGHTPHALTDAVADIAIGLMLSAARRFHEGRQKIEKSQWENYHLQWMLGQETRDKTVGFFGFGGIGQTIGKRLSGFDVGKILYTTRRRVNVTVEEKLNAQHVPMDEMLQQSDIIFIAAPLTKETTGVFNASAFEKMKPTAVLVNIARGPIVVQDDLYEALKSNKIFAAGIDVMVPEPLPADDKLLTLPNCVIIPHLGSATLKTRTDMAMLAAQNILSALQGREMPAPAFKL